ncbi:hypothetical protein FLA_0474 [Filimonas lacunae]|nr:hypothetical protein FLA_0474 [Filimonas lacunae]
MPASHNMPVARKRRAHIQKWLPNKATANITAKVAATASTPVANAPLLLIAW